MKYITLLILLMFLTACSLQNLQTNSSVEVLVDKSKTTPPAATQQPQKSEVKEEIFVKETVRRYGIELDYSGVRAEDDILCVTLYAEDITPSRSVLSEDKDPNSWNLYIYRSPDEIIKMDRYATPKSASNSEWTNKFCLVTSEIPPEFYAKEARILYSTVFPKDVEGESFLAIENKDNTKTFTFKDLIK